jgi:hypothetical protein
LVQSRGIFPTFRWKGPVVFAFFSALLKVVRYLPLLILVVAMLPTWLSWIFLSVERRESALKMVRELRRWAASETDQREMPNDSNAFEKPSVDGGREDSDV